MKLSVLMLFISVVIADWNFDEDSDDDAYDAFVNPLRCYEELETGICRAMYPRWGYVPAKRDCVEFAYGGCGGNANRFKTRKECYEACFNPFYYFPSRDHK